MQTDVCLFVCLLGLFALSLLGFDLDDDSNTTTTTFGQQYHDIKKQKKQQEEEKEEDAEKSRAEELLLELIELKEEGKFHWFLVVETALDQIR